MEDGFKEGNKITRRFTVDEGRTISVAGGEFKVYATPEMIRDIEQTCKKYILEFADENEDSVGTQVNIAHVGATVMGMSVEVTATVKTLDRRRVVFDITVKDDLEEVGRGTHDRFITDASKSAERLRAKAEKAGL
ncbi:MAG: LysR family transcriptional regulator [Rhodospirillaceae bacterium]|nr:LysR family transcriptional regulator [Rhodospirillaceae bacterium]|tara:strand:- start:425 stop:829 length:405 start_codon:yes stop_codon:yes gene_type:complete